MALFSIKHNFIFIHIYKCAGTSIRTALRSAPDLCEAATGHSTALETRQWMQQNNLAGFWQLAFKFAVVRHPFDWLVSQYEYTRQQPTHPQHHAVKHMSLADYIEFNGQCISRGEKNYNGGYHTQCDFVLDEHLQPLIKNIYRLESLCLPDLCKTLKLPPVDVRANESKRTGHWKNYYTPAAGLAAVTNFKNDFKEFGYSWL